MSEYSFPHSRSTDNLDSVPRSPSAFDFEEINAATVLYKMPIRRPRIQEIRNIPSPNAVAVPAETLDTIELESKEHRYGWVLGVFFPVLVNLLSVSYYIENTQNIMTIGWGQTAIFYILSIATSFGTLISICVFATNGEMRDGGLYYLISRTLGPRIGNSTGIILIIAHISAISSRLYRFGSVIAHIIDRNQQDYLNYEIAGIQLVALIVVIAFAILSPHALTLSLAPMGVITVIGGILAVLGLLIPHSGSPSYLSGPNIKSLADNFSGQAPPIGLFFGLLYPASNSLLAVSNFGGSLHKPRSQVPIGGLTAAIVCSILNVCTMCIQAASYDFTSPPSNSGFMFIDSSISPLLSSIGFACATIGSTLTLCAGGARVVIAMAQDESLPQVFSRPIITHISIGVVAALLALWPTGADNISRTFFPLPYCLINYAVYTAASAHYPGFRPGFKLYNKYLALFLAFIHFGQALCGGYYAFFVVGVFVLSYYLYKNFPDTWGTVTQTRYFYDALENCLSLYHRKPNPKTYRPGFFYLITEHPDAITDVLHFLNEIVEGRGMMTVGRVTSKASWESLLSERESVRLDFGTFYSVTSSVTFSEGASDLMSLVGIGNMRPNTIVLPFLEKWQQGDPYEPTEYLAVLKNAMDSGFGCSIIRNTNFAANPEGTIDVWWLHDDGGLTLLLPYMLSQNKKWKKCHLRVIIFASSVDGDDIDSIQLEMVKYLYLVRISAEVMVVDVDWLTESPTPLSLSKWKSMMGNKDDTIDKQTKKNLLISDLVRQISMTASFVSISLPVPDESVAKHVYMSWIDIISSLSVPFMFIRGTGESVLNSKI